MKLAKLIVPAAISVLLLQACSNDRTTSTSTEVAPTEDATTTKAAATTSSNKANTSTEATENEKATIADPATLLSTILATAKNGQLPNVPFTVGQTTFSDIKDQWGEPNLSFLNTANFVQYRAKKSEHIAYGLGIGRGHILYDLRTFVADDGHTPLSSISFKQIQQLLGKPEAVAYKGPDRTWTYTAGQYKLQFTGNRQKRMLHHISVYSAIYDDSKQ